VAEIGAELDRVAITLRAGPSRLRRAASRRAAVGVGALTLAIVGVVALVAHPATRTRAEARFTVPIPLSVADAIGAIRTHAEGATATAQGRRIVVTSSDASAEVARAHAAALARTGLDAARQRLVAVETRRVEAARSDRANAVAQLATIASHTGLTDPESAYRERAALVQSLQAQRAAAAAAGRPVAAIDAQIADNQQAAFDLQLQVTRHTELIQAETTAARRELEATRAIETATRAVGSASVRVSDHSTGTGLSIAFGVAALAIAGVGLVFSELRSHYTASRRAGAEASRKPKSVGDRDDVALAASEAAALESCGLGASRYLDFYRALAPSPAEELDPAALPVDLVHEEALEESRDLEEQTARDHDGSRP
jgi:hypothetical protein